MYHAKSSTLGVVMEMIVASADCMSAADFRKILKRNGFIDKDSTVRRYAGLTKGQRFEVITKRSKAKLKTFAW